VDRRVENGFNATFANWTVNSTNSTIYGVPIEAIDNVSESFTYRFLPVYLMSLFSSLWIGADWYYRMIQPYASMHEAAPATSNLLLDYPSSAPGFVTWKALMNGHWRVALFSALSLSSTAPPIIATGVFTSTPTPTGYIVSIEPINFWASFVILILYIFFLILLRPTPAYRLPRVVESISDVLSYCYSSRILDDVSPDGKPVFSAQDVGDSKLQLDSRIHLAKKKYVFGLYLGKDGKWHMGFDIDERVTRYDPGRAFRPNWYLREPAKIVPPVV
jgi:hypothetical protein